MMHCEQCGKPMKERLATDEFVGTQCQVTITGIPSGICPYCGNHALDAGAMDEIEMFVRPLLAGGVGMRLLQTPHLTIDLGHSLHPSAIDIARPSFLVRQFGEPALAADRGRDLFAEPIAATDKARAA